MARDDEIIDGKRAFRRAWRRAPRAVRIRVTKAVAEGSAVDDPEDAALAVGFARQTLKRAWFVPSPGVRFGNFIWMWRVRKHAKRALEANLELLPGTDAEGH